MKKLMTIYTSQATSLPFPPPSLLFIFDKTESTFEKHKKILIDNILQYFPKKYIISIYV